MQKTRQILWLAGASAFMAGSLFSAPAADVPQRLTVLGETRVYDIPAHYASFPGLVCDDKGVALTFTIQTLEALKASGLHPHYAPVIQYRYARSRDNGLSWEVSSEPVPVRRVAHATRFMHSASAAMPDGGLLTCFVDYDRGTRTRQGTRMQIHQGRLGGVPQLAWTAGAIFTNLAPFSMIPSPEGGFLLSAQQTPNKPRGCAPNSKLPKGRFSASASC